MPRVHDPVRRRKGDGTVSVSVDPERFYQRRNTNRPYWPEEETPSKNELEPPPPQPSTVASSPAKASSHDATSSEARPDTVTSKNIGEKSGTSPSKRSLLIKRRRMKKKRPSCEEFMQDDEFSFSASCSKPKKTPPEPAQSSTTPKPSDNNASKERTGLSFVTPLAAAEAGDTGGKLGDESNIKISSSQATTSNEPWRSPHPNAGKLSQQGEERHSQQKQEVVELRAECNKKDEVIKQLNQQLVQKDQESHMTAETQNQHHEAELGKLRKETSDKDELIKHLRQQLEQKEKQHQLNLQEAVEETKKTLGADASKLAELERDLKELNYQLGDKNTKLELNLSTMLSLSSRNKQLGKDNQRLDKENGRLSEELNNEVAAFKAAKYIIDQTHEIMGAFLWRPVALEPQGAVMTQLRIKAQKVMKLQPTAEFGRYLQRLLQPRQNDRQQSTPTRNNNQAKNVSGKTSPSPAENIQRQLQQRQQHMKPRRLPMQRQGTNQNQEISSNGSVAPDLSSHFLCSSPDGKPKRPVPEPAASTPRVHHKQHGNSRKRYDPPIPTFTSDYGLRKDIDEECFRPSKKSKTSQSMVEILK